MVGMVGRGQRSGVAGGLGRATRQGGGVTERREGGWGGRREGREGRRNGVKKEERKGEKRPKMCAVHYSRLQDCNSSP